VKATGKARLAKKTVARNTDPGMVLAFPSPDKPTPKTRLNPKQLLEFKQLLLLKRAELAGDVSHLAEEVLDRKGRGPNEHTSMPIHMADVGSDNWEKEFTFGLIASEHARIREIDAALTRMSDRTYGVCLATHKNISVARLRAKPWAKYCIEYARAREEGRAL
jgi:DnaK suppressor protein